MAEESRLGIRATRIPVSREGGAFPTQAVANWFLSRAKATGGQLDPMKLQKLMYIAHGWHLALTEGQPLLDEEVQAWRYGPVIPAIYHEFKEFGAGPITHPAGRFRLEGTKVVFHAPELDLSEFSDTAAILGRVWEQYHRFTGVQLSSMTHQPGTPWDKVWNQPGVRLKSRAIPNSVIQEHYEELAQQNRSKASGG